MAQEDNFFALLGDEEGDDMSKLIDRVKQEEMTNTSKVQKKKKEEKKMAHQIPTDMRAKRLVLPSHVKRSFIVFDKKKEREKTEAEARKKAEDSVESNGGQSTTLNSYHRKNGGSYIYQRNNGGDNVYQQSNDYNGYIEGNYRRVNGYQPRNSVQYMGSYKGSGGNQRYYRNNNRVSNGDQLNNGADPSGNITDDGWQYVGRGRRNNRVVTYQEHLTHKQDGIKHGSFEESNNSEKDLEKSVNEDKSDDITENKDLVEQQEVETEVQGHLPVSTEGQEDDQSEKKSSDGQDGAKSEKKSKKKESQDIFEKKDEKEEEKKNLMTLEEYERKMLEDRKILEAFKRPEQRKVEDKDFESMQLIGKKKEDGQKSEERLKKKDNIKEEKVLKTLSINEFLKSAEGKTPYMRQRWNGDRPYGRRDTVRFNRNGNGGRHDGRRPYGQGDGDYGHNGMDAEESPNGRRYAGDRHNSKRYGDAENGPGLASPPPSFCFEHHEFPALG
ncbi:RGG repeats nuclear RNA binding protein A-like [Durio zibethinus]|uniref:RGG repeats nuclear RNA binding protein A-like n=1 Tax=Durio zibethinus TaxID=66656 RepID=A0A6P6A472_DURZI|nr:RGG repeats nuclear RNA binding protein A-like [Durio zibethinus]